MNKQEEGFTLIELLVVIAVIGILASVIVASLTSARVKSRNARRGEDVRGLMTAYNLAYNANGIFVDNGGSYSCISSTCYGGWSSYTANTIVDSFFVQGSSQKPVDPAGGRQGIGGYLYNSNFNGSPIINWLAEPQTSQNVCAPGVVNSTSANHVDCVLYLK